MLLALCSFFLALVLDASAIAAPIATSAARHHGWIQRQRASSHSPIKLHIALRSANRNAAVTTLMQISDPYSLQFRSHLTAHEVDKLSAPDASSVDAVMSWLGRHVSMVTQPSAGLVEVETTIGVAEEMLDTTYYVYTDVSDSKREVVRAESFALPDDVAAHVDFVTPTTVFPKPPLRSIRHNQNNQQIMSTQKRESCGANDNTMPTCVRQIYGIDYTAQPNRTTFAVYGTEAASFNPSDLQKYLSTYNPPAAAASASYTVIGNGDPSSTTSGIEAKFETALDTQTLLGLAWPATAILYDNGGVFGPAPGQTYDRFVQFLHDLITNDTVPSVVSFSESMPEDMIDPAYAKRVCSMMAQVGARGVSLLFSSGDNGPNGDTSSGKHNAIFEPEFPASCPWVTAVGGTTNLANETAATKQTISLVGQATYAASGGGFSNLFEIPAYQNPAVRTYVQNHIPASYANVSGFNPSGRAIPDVSAFSTNFPTVVSLVANIPLTVPIGGTSASTPLWAAVVTLLNDYEASQGRPPLGFLNPFLYSLKSGLKDITTGGNSAGSCNLLAGCTLPETLGYDVTTGYDPVTGLGSPVWPDLVNALDSLACRKNATRVDFDFARGSGRARRTMAQKPWPYK